jgi:hypothetical protein
MSGPKWSLVGAGDSAVKGVGLQPLDFWDCGFESLRKHGYSFVVFLVRCAG